MKKKLSDLLVVSDLDNTLLAARNGIPQVNRDMIQLFCARGGRFTVASGRSVASVQSAMAGIPLSAPVICCGGSILYDFTKQQCLEQHTLDRTQAEPLLCDIRRHFPEAGICVYTGMGSWHVVQSNLHLEMQRRSEGVGCILSQLCDVPDGWAKAVIADGAPLLDTMEQYLQQYKYGEALSVVRTGSGALNLLPQGISKASALHALSEVCHVPLENIIVIGDHYSDLGAMQQAGQAVAVAGAPARVRLAASTVTSIGCGEGAVAEYLYGLVRRYEADT